MAVLSVALVLIRPDLLDTIILLDMTLLGYHHVIATFTRVNFVPEKARENRALLVYMPVVVLAGVALLAWGWGAIIVTTIYLHWQWWHYTRQSEGIAKAYSMKSGVRLEGNELFNRSTFYIVPVAAFLSMSSRNPSTFLFSGVYTLPVPAWLANLVLIVAVLAFSFWLVIQMRALLARRLSPLVFTYFISHFGIYIFAYHIITDVTVGWLLINVWHNLQYITFVWMCNVNQFGKRPAGITKLRAWFCKPSNWFFYFAACYFLTDFLYGGVDQLIQWLVLATGTSLPMMVIVYQAINFHHYIVDTCIWKLRKPATRAAAGIDA